MFLEISLGSGFAPVVGVEPPEQRNWLPGMDSNHDSRLQRPLSYH